MSDRLNIVSPPDIAALPYAQQLVLYHMVALEQSMPPTTYSAVFLSAGQLAELTAVPYDDALSAANALWLADAVTCYQITNADNAGHTFTAYGLATHTRHHRADTLRLLAHELSKHQDGEL